MADNYLERRMEDYRSGKLSSMRMTSATVKRPSMTLRAYVVGGDTELGIRYVRNLRASNWKVAFNDADLKSGRQLAQATGAQHHPVSSENAEAMLCSLKKVLELWGAVDLVVNCVNADLHPKLVEAITSLQVPIINAR